jgi:hypothetical protein
MGPRSSRLTQCSTILSSTIPLHDPVPLGDLVLDLEAKPAEYTPVDLVERAAGQPLVVLRRHRLKGSTAPAGD